MFNIAPDSTLLHSSLYSTVLADCLPQDQIVYSPFKPWFAFSKGSSQLCWNHAICVFSESDEARKQQFAATALIMGLLPLTLKDIAWPERRIVSVSQPLPLLVEILVRALSLEPVEAVGDTLADRRKSAESWSTFLSPTIAGWAWGLERRTIWLLMTAATITLFITYAALAIVEIFSKRSSLGCVYPIFVLTWYLVALLPAAIHTVLSNIRHKRQKSRARRNSILNLQPSVSSSPTNENRAEIEPTKDKGAHNTNSNEIEDSPNATAEKLAEPLPHGNFNHLKIASAVQGANEWWLVQLIWAIYYICGTLVFTSIMAVTVIELFVWVLIGFSVTGASKLLAFFLCLSFEVTGKNRRQISPEGQ